VPEVERSHKALDRAPLPRGVPALAQRADRPAEPLVAQLSPEVQAQLGKAPLGRLQAFLVLVLVELEA